MSATLNPPVGPSGKRPGEKPEWARGLPDETEDGDPIVYGPEPMAPRVARVEALDGHTLLATFATGERRRYDVRPLLDCGIFRRLQDLEAFAAIAVDEMGGVVWESGADLSRDTIYLAGEPV